MKLSFVQYTYSAPVEEYNAMVYVKRRDTFHVDSSPDLYGEIKYMFLSTRHTIIILWESSLRRHLISTHL